MRPIYSPNFCFHFAAFRKSNQSSAMSDDDAYDISQEVKETEDDDEDLGLFSDDDVVDLNSV